MSNREHQEVSREERHCEDGSDPCLLDVMAVPLVEARPHFFQQENWLLDPNFYWRKTGRVDWAELQAFVDLQGPLWLNQDSSFNDLNDRIILAQANQLRSSLRLIHVDQLMIEVSCPGAAFGNPKRRVQGQFMHAGVHYFFWLTDPVYERRLLVQPNGIHKLGEGCLTISLGEPFLRGLRLQTE